MSQLSLYSTRVKQIIPCPSALIQRNSKCLKPSSNLQSSLLKVASKLKILGSSLRLGLAQPRKRTMVRSQTTLTPQLKEHIKSSRLTLRLYIGMRGTLVKALTASALASMVRLVITINLKSLDTILPVAKLSLKKRSGRALLDREALQWFELVIDDKLILSIGYNIPKTNASFRERTKKLMTLWKTAN